jgi:hypothetical protein
MDSGRLIVLAVAFVTNGLYSQASESDLFEIFIDRMPDRCGRYYLLARTR